jgi:metal-dependent amidase/aminoacylase/carboxypeptidase family protein
VLACRQGRSNGTAEAAGILHNPHYDFNDEVLPFGASYWVRLAESVLAVKRAAA